MVGKRWNGALSASGLDWAGCAAGGCAGGLVWACCELANWYPIISNKARVVFFTSWNFQYEDAEKIKCKTILFNEKKNFLFVITNYS